MEKSVTEKTKKLRVARPELSDKAARQLVIQQYEGILRPDVVLPWDDEELAGCTVADVLADPAKFAGETLADPLEGVDYGRCKAKIMIYDDGTPWIHSFAHGRTFYYLKYDAAAVRRVMEAAPADAVATLVRLVPGADIDEVELEVLRQLAKELSGAGLRVINSVLKVAQTQHDAQQAKAKRAFYAANRRDPRPRLEAPKLSAPWLPHMGVLNEVISAVVADMPPSRNINADMTQLRKLPVSNMHAFTNGPEEGEDQ